jgi:hypothetical protein
MPERGQPGKPGEHGEPGEPGKESGEGGRGGGGGEGGEGGEGTPKGPGGEGGGGGIGGRGARGAQGPPGPPGPQPKLRWAPAVGYVLLAVVLGFLIWRTQTLVIDNRRLIADVAAINQAQAERNYTDCITRNNRAAEAIKSFKKLITAHTRDGNLDTAKVWKEYLDATERVPLPSCIKPAPPP